MKAPKPVLLFLFVLFFTDCIAQKQQWLQYIMPPVARRLTSVDCNAPVPLTSCNYISNKTFTPGPAYNPNDFNQFLDPFGLQLIPGWEASHGTPQLVPNMHMTGTAPVPGAMMAYLPASSSSTLGVPAESEGIVNHIPQLTTGHQYSFSFFKKFEGYIYPNAVAIESFRVVLLNCEDYRDNVYTTSYYTPQVPSHSQVIYCETNLFNASWQQINVCFTANSDYDMIWIFPDYPAFVPPNPNNITGGLLFAYPELFDVTNFTAGPEPTVTYPACNVTIGPSVPNCAPVNASFYWTSPSGQIFPVSASNQQLSVNAATNYGVWTLHMTVPGAVTTNNTCGQACVITKTVTVTQCSPCPVISPSGPVEYYYPNFEQNVSLTFTSTFATGNQWYIDGVPVSGATNPNFTYEWATAMGGTETHQVSVQVPGCPPSTPVSVSFIPHFHPCNTPFVMNDHCAPPGINTPYSYCENTTSYMQTFDMGPSASYSWNFITLAPPSIFAITSQAQNVAQVSIGDLPTTPYAGGSGWVVAKSQLGGHIKYFEYSFSITTDESLAGLGGCATTWHADMTIMKQPSGFDYEFYDFGAAEILSVDPVPSAPYFQTPHTLLTNGMNPLLKIKLRRNGITNYTVQYYNNNNDDCANALLTIIFDNNCTPAWRGVNPPAIVTEVPVKDKETIEPRIDEIQIASIQRIEIFNTAGQVLKQLTGTTEINDVLKYNRSTGLSSGLYFLRIVYKDKTVKVVRKLLY